MRIHLLAGLDVVGYPHHEVGSRKARTLLAVLAAARGRTVTGDVLVEILWPDVMPARPAEQVQVLVSRLRATFGVDRVTRTGAGYALNYDWLDLDELDARADEARSRLAAGSVGAARAAAAAAMRLVRGVFLAGDDSEWAEQERRIVERTIARVRLIGAEAALAAGDPTEAGALAEGALDHDPYDERALRALMAAHAAAGRPASALAAYARCRQQLSENLGVDPAPETAALHTSILRGEILAMATPARGPGAAPTGPLVGRAAEFAALDRELALVGDGGSRVVVVHGEPGIGKTALVSTWARSVADGALVMSARCDELGRELPLQPVLDMLSFLLRHRGPAEAERILGADTDLLAPLLGLGDRSPVRLGTGATAMTDIAAGRTRLFAALVDVAERAGTGLTVIVVDDLHLGAASTIAWFEYAVRRAAGLLIVATWCPGPGRPTWPSGLSGTAIALGPLDLDATRDLVGPDRAVALHQRSGGNALFLVELARSAGDDLPATIVEAVGARADALGAAAGPIRTAAVLGPEVDVDLLAACTQRSMSDVLDALETAARSGLLVERGAGFAFAHELVREALAADVTAARRSFVHREAAEALRQRADGRSLHTAFHARLGGAGDVAAAALVDGAEVAAGRFDLEVAERLVDQAIGLADGAGPRLARARVRMARSDHTGAFEDVSYAIGPDAGADAFELAGWIAYYRRDYALAHRYADEAVRRADVDAGVRASALALGGRIRHSRGLLHDAAAELEEAVTIAPSDVRGVAEVWLASLRVHQGRPGDALAMVEHFGDDDVLSHPFALAHALFARTLASGLVGRLDNTSVAIAALERVVDRLGPSGRRFAPVARNMRSWLLRSTGREGEADEMSEAAVELSHGTTFEEPQAHARLDLAESRLRAGDHTGAAAAVDDVAATLDDGSTMAWHVRQRILWMRGRLAREAGQADRAVELATALIDDATVRGSARYGVLGQHLAMIAAPAGQAPSTIRAILSALDQQAGIDAWWLVAELAAATDIDGGWTAAERRATRLLASTGPDVDRDAMARWLDLRLDQQRRRGRSLKRSRR